MACNSFFNAMNVLSSEIHHHICQAYGDKAMGYGRWMMIWCVRSTKECVTTDVSQFLICPCTFQRFQGLYDIVSSHLGYRRPHSVRRVHKNLCTAIMSANMWENSLKNVESDKNKILHENLLDFFYSETVLTFWMNLVTCITLFVQTFNSFGNINFWLIKHLTNYFL